MRQDRERGFALVTVMLLAGMVTALLAAYFFLTRVEFQTTKSSLAGNRGFYAAEAGLNIRADLIRETFEGYNRPSGTSPVPTPGLAPCQGGDMGTGDFACVGYGLQDRDVQTHVVEDADNPSWIVIPPGELYQNLNAQVYGYDIASVAVSPHDDTEAILDMHALVRLVPLFQFAVFYDKDLEILPGPAMTLAGPVHTNHDLYVDAGSSLTIEGQVTVGEEMFHGRKEINACNGPVAVFDPAAALNIPGCAGGRVQILPTDTGPWNGMIRIGVEPVTVPPPEALDATPGQIYWDKADLRVMLDLTGALPEIEVRNPDNTVDIASSNFLNAGCGLGGNAVGSTSTDFYNFREATDISMLEIDMGDLLDCIESNNGVMGGKALDDATEGGLVFYFGVDGPNSGVVNNYGVRVQNGAHLAPTVGPTSIRGLTIVTDQAFYVQGSYNSDMDWKPAAFLADSLNVLSNNWDDANSDDPDQSHRIGTSTAIYAAFLAGTDSTGDTEGVPDLGIYNGGVENYPRFHEKWTGNTLTYRGSFVSLDRPRHVDGHWGDQSYSPPIRDWGFDQRFNDAANLPPLSPRFVYLKQDQFLRRFNL